MMEFYLNIEYQTNQKQSLSVFLINNFKIIPFELNNVHNDKFNLIIEATDNPKQTNNNIVKIENLTSYTNDFCFLFVSDSAVYTKRFFIKCTSCDNITPDIVMLNYSVGQSDDDENIISLWQEKSDQTILENSNSYCISINIKNALESSSFYENYVSSNKYRIPYALICITKNGLITERPYFFSTDTSYATANFKLTNTDGSFFVIVFPFAYSFNEEFTSTYKAVLWSNPLVASYYGDF